MFSILSKFEVSKLVERTIDAAFHVDSDSELRWGSYPTVLSSI